MREIACQLSFRGAPNYLPQKHAPCWAYSERSRPCWYPRTPAGRGILIVADKLTGEGCLTIRRERSS